MMLYRIISIHKKDSINARDMRVIFYNNMCESGLFCPNDLQLKYQKCRFWFTEHGWENIGKKCFESLSDVKILSVELPKCKAYIVFQDINQVALFYKYGINAQVISLEREPPHALVVG